MKAKNAAVCHVQAIQLIAELRPVGGSAAASPSSRPVRPAHHTRPSEKPFAM